MFKNRKCNCRFVCIIKTLFNERTHLTRSIVHEALKNVSYMGTVKDLSTRVTQYWKQKCPLPSYQPSKVSKINWRTSQKTVSVLVFWVFSLEKTSWYSTTYQSKTLRYDFMPYWEKRLVSLFYHRVYLYFYDCIDLPLKLSFPPRFSR